MEYICKTPVIVVFFNRPQCLKEVLLSLQKVKPPVLYFAQDGCRDLSDKEKVQECRDLINKFVTWDCKIYKRFSDINLGCEENEYSGIKWAFEKENKLIVLEDDVVASVSFYRFCDELLEKYEYDYRINSINGFINVDYSTPYSYVFCNIGSSYGWATWKRCFEQWDPSLKIIENDEETKKLKQIMALDNVMRPIWEKRIWSQHKLFDGKCQGWESLYYLSRVCFSQHCICCSKSLVKNIGLGSDALHGGRSSLSRSQIEVFEKDANEIEFPLKHPPYMIHDYELDIISSKVAYNYRWWKKIIPQFMKNMIHSFMKKKEDFII